MKSLMSKTFELDPSSKSTDNMGNTNQGFKFITVVFENNEGKIIYNIVRSKNPKMRGHSIQREFYSNEFYKDAPTRSQYKTYDNSVDFNNAIERIERKMEKENGVIYM